MRKIFILLCLLLSKYMVQAQSSVTVSTGSDKYVLLESVVSATVPLTPQAYCIQDSLRNLPRLHIMNVHSQGWSSLYADSMACTGNDQWASTYLIGIPSGTIDRTLFSGSVAVNRGNWANAYATQAAGTAQYQLSMTVKKNGSTLNILLRGKALAALSGLYHFNVAVLEDSLVYNQKNQTIVGSCPYMSGGITLHRFTHRDVLRDMLGGSWGTFVRSNPALHQEDTLTFTYTIPSAYDIKRLHLIGMVQKYNSADKNDRVILNSIGLKVSELCDLNINTQPVSQLLPEGGNAQFVFSSGNSSAVYQWQSNNGSGFQNISNGGQYSGANSSSLSVLNIGSNNQNQQFRCIVNIGSCRDTSQVATLTLSCNLQITAQASPVQAPIGGTALFRIASNQANSTFQWQSNAGTGYSSLSNIGQYSGANDDTLYVSNINVSNHGQLFRCIVQSGSCKDTSDEVAISVVCNSLINTEPTNQSVNPGNAAQFTVASTNAGSNYQWQTDMGLGFQNISNAGQYTGTNSASLSISNTSLANHNQMFRCIVSLGSCIDTSASARLSVTNGTGVAQQKEASFKLYPNPTRDILVLEIHKPELIGTAYQVYDSYGKLVHSGIIRQGKEEVELAQLAKGIYTLRLGPSGVHTFRIVKQ